MAKLKGKAQNDAVSVLNGLSHGRDVTPDRLTTLIYGREKDGKTTLAATASADYDESKIAAGEECELTDTVWWAIDNEALIGLAERKIYPKYVLDFPMWLGEGGDFDVPNIDKAVEHAMKITTHLYNEEGIKNVVIDTISELDRYIVSHCFSPGVAATTRDGEVDGMRTFGRVLDRHVKLLSLTRMLPVRWWILCHAKVNTMQLDSKASTAAVAAARNEATRDGIVVPDITGKARSLWARNVSQTLVLKAEPNLKTKQIERTLHPYADKDHPAGTRLQKSLPDKAVPADLGAMLRRIEGSFK